MSTRLASLVIDAIDPAHAAQFWYIMLGGTATPGRAGCHRLVAPDLGGCGLDLAFVPARWGKTGKNRIHLDLATESAHEYQVLTSLAADVGATEVNVGQGPGVPWTVFRDPEGNEFCILEPGDLYHHTGPLAALVVDAADPLRQATFWSAATGWPLVHAEENSAALRATDTTGPWIEFLRVPEERHGPNRVSLDLAATDDDADTSHLLDIGATRADGVLLDPEGNEFRLVPTRPVSSAGNGHVH
ncbi:VOC family protein [Actinokineospora inagensis]|uniref:VOC family protein n=1 Tax=Actinokineospora inagensis TaxID=103730 RepID=UPI0003FFA8B8|nr:VOC family protein [Actinokineospora inagensis]